MKNKMIGTLPVSKLAPLEYRYALDAAMPLLSGSKPPLAIVNAASLTGEVQQRLTSDNETSQPRAGLWIEPLAFSWESDLQAFTKLLLPDALLAIILSRPFARMLPERRSWTGQALGMQPSGIYRLHKALTQNRFVIEASYGVHTLAAIGLNLISQGATRLGRPDLSDRLLFAAKLRYNTAGLLAPLSTVGLILARKGER